MLEKIRLLGSGAHGTVHLATSWDSPSSWYAVKSSEFLDSFSLQKERRVYSRLHCCPEIVNCFGDYSSTEDGAHIYNLVLEYASGGSLYDLMPTYPGRRVPEADVSLFTRMLLRGLSYIHSLGYVHCDLKPENVLVFRGVHGTNRQLKIADFGLAKEPDREENRCAGTFRGTPLFMSPESVEFGEIGPKLDIWSLGCIVLEMLSGRPAYENVGGDLEELMCRLVILKEVPKIPGELSMECKDFLGKCLTGNPGARWSADMLLSHPFVAECSSSSSSSAPRSPTSVLSCMLGGCSVWC